eukprot:1975233-Alexandrium_andersonii.AAC.1
MLRTAFANAGASLRADAREKRASHKHVRNARAAVCNAYASLQKDRLEQQVPCARKHTWSICQLQWGETQITVQ